MTSPQTADNHIGPNRLLTVYMAIALVFGFYLFRLFELQIINGAEYQARADDNRRTILHTPTLRGEIYDRNGYLLAGNVPAYNVVITPAYLPEDSPDTADDDGATQAIFRQLSELIGLPAMGPEPDSTTVRNFTPCRNELTISQIVYIGATNWPYDPIRVKCDVDEVTARIILEKKADWPGVDIEVEPVREYPTGQLTAEIIGFLGPIPAGSEDLYPGFVLNRDKVGFGGIEKSLQDVLAGQNGLREVEVFASGKLVRDLTVPISPVPGNNVRLTIDTRLQAVAKAALEQQIDYLHAKAPSILESNGVVIAMNPQTGEILSLVSFPTYENNRMARAIPGDYYEQLMANTELPLFNHAISATHPPGSVFKMAAALGILNEGVVTPDTVIHDPGIIELEQRFLSNEDNPPKLKYYCWNYRTGGHGDVSFLKGVAESCDVYFYKVGGGFEGEISGGGLGIWRLAEYARALGYDRLTGIELPGEAVGTIPTPKWKRLRTVDAENWATGDTYINTIGQGFVEATALQVLVSIATIANDGKMMKPTLIEEISDAAGHVVDPFEPELVCDITQMCIFPKWNDFDELIWDESGNLATETRYAIRILDENGDPTGESKPIAPWVIQLAKEGMRLVVTEGTAKDQFAGMEIPSAGKTGTAEYCDDRARDLLICKSGAWPAHAWYAGYAPYDNPEIAVVAFIYHGTEGSVMAAPVVRKVLEAYFELKAIDQAEFR